jgi:hypothetical protein
MNRTMLFGLRLGALTLALSASLAHAGKIETVGQFASGKNVVAMMESESILFAEAYRAKIVEAGLVSGGKSSVWNSVQSAVHGSTLARMEYVYTKGGRQFTRVYHARSGPAMEVVLNRHSFAPPGDTTGSGSGASGSEGSRPYEITDDDIATDFRERVYYPADTEFNVRVPNLLPTNSVIKARPVGGKNIHTADAELKIFRQIEADINQGVVTRGGTLTGYVSKAICSSCDAASESLAEEFDINGTIRQLVEPGISGPSRDEALRASQASSAELKEFRKEYARTLFKVNVAAAPPAKSWIDLDSVVRMETEEAGADLAGTCED